MTTESEVQDDEAFQQQHFANPKERTDKLLQVAKDLSEYTFVPPADDVIEGEKTETNEFGDTLTERWGLNPDSDLKFGEKEGHDMQGGWWEERWRFMEDGTFETQGSNSQVSVCLSAPICRYVCNACASCMQQAQHLQLRFTRMRLPQGHMWGERAGKFENGTTWREKWLEKTQVSLALSIWRACRCLAPRTYMHGCPHSILACVRTSAVCGWISGRGVKAKRFA